jgi:hypothetical protein
VRRITMKSFVIGVIVAWALLFGVGYVVKGTTPGYPVLHVFSGFVLGMLAMYIATRVYQRPRSQRG